MCFGSVRGGPEKWKLCPCSVESSQVLTETELGGLAQDIRTSP